MATLIPRPIIKAWAEDTSNKDAPSQTTIGAGIPYQSALTSSGPNGSQYIIFEAVKNLQRTGGLYGATIPYSQGQSCSIVCRVSDRFEIRRFIYINASEGTGQAPMTGTVSTLNGVDVYSGGVVNSTYWQDADAIDGYAIADTVIAYDGTASSVPAFGACTVGKRQYVNVAATARTSINPETDRYFFAKAPTLDEMLGILDGLYMPKWYAMKVDIVTYPFRRLGVYWFRGVKVEAIGRFMNGDGFTENGTSNNSLFWRSFDPAYAQCIISNVAHRDLFMSGSEGHPISVQNYIGRVPACVGTPASTGLTFDARAGLGATQNDQMQAHGHNLRINGTVGNADNLSATYYMNAVAQGGFYPGAKTTDLNNTTVIGGAITDGVHGTPRTGYNTRECTYSVPVPMLVSLLPYGTITL